MHRHAAGGDPVDDLAQALPHACGGRARDFLMSMVQASSRLLGKSICTRANLVASPFGTSLNQSPQAIRRPFR
jgi:hypothetical protein